MSNDGSSVVKQQLYRLYGVDGELLYIGISYSAIARYAQHKTNQPWIGDVTRIEIETHECSRREIEAIERDAIIVERPLHNIAHNVTKATKSTVMPVEFDATAFLVPTQSTNTWFEACQRLDWLARDLDYVADISCGTTPSRADFITAINGVTRSLIYADSCDKCNEIRYPIALRYETTTWVKCAYWCGPCRHSWPCGWSADLALVGSIK